MKYKIITTETIGSEYEVDADNEQEAIDKLGTLEPVKTKPIEWEYEIEELS